MTEHPQAPQAGQPGNPENHIHSAQPSEGSPAPTAQNPTEPLSSGHRADGSGATAFNAGATAAHPVAPPAVEQPTAAYPTAAYVPPAAGTAFSAHPAQPVSTDRPARRRLTVPVVAALAVGALIGGASGAGISLLSRTDNASSSAASSSSVPANITVNNPANATTITAVAASASPSVVTISVSGSNGAGTGSGVILSADGYVLTNTHVVTLDGATANPTIQVQTNDGKLYSAKIVGTDPVSDLAVIKLDNASGLAVAKWADSSKLNVGDAAIAIGAPLGLSGTVTNGIVSALNRSITVASSAVPSAPSAPSSPSPQQNPFDFWNFSTPGQQAAPRQGSGSVALSVIQTDAAINPGNSGGALLNSNGEVIGINVAIANAGSSASTTGSIGVGFALPSNLAKRVSSELIANGVATHGLLGASVADANGSKDGSSTLTAGALVDVVSPGGAAEQAGLRKGDVVTVFNGIPIKGSTDLTAQVRALPAGSKAKLTYVRNGNSSTVEVTLGSYKP